MPDVLEKDKALVYRWRDCYISPYPTPSLLARAFLQMESEDLLDTVFYEKRPDVGWFVNEFTKNNAILACWVRTGNSGVLTQDLELAGLTFFNSKWKIGASTLNRSEVGVVFFRKFWKRKWTLTLAAMSAEWAFDHLNVHMMLGTTPEPNKAACRFFRALGWISHGPVIDFTTFPGVEGLVGVYLSQMTKPLWQTVRTRWFNS